MSHVTTHILDAALGMPAAGVSVALSGPTGEVIATGMTNTDGRIPELGDDRLAVGEYRLEFDTGSYFASTGRESFYPKVTVDFMVSDGAHYHVPLLLSPFAYSTYRGS